MRMKKLIGFIFIVGFVGWMNATISLANSGYPMAGANPQRNYKVNKPVLCSSISRGKTTVLNEIWQLPSDPLSSFQVQQSSYDLIQDGKGFGYVLGYDSFAFMIKVNTTDGSYDPEKYYVPEEQPFITMLNEDKFYWSGTFSTIIVNSTTMTQSLNFGDSFNFGLTTMVPYKNDWLVKPRAQADLSDNIIMYFKDSILDVDGSLPDIQGDFSGTLVLNDLLVYKSSTSSTEFPIVVARPTELGGPSIVASPSYLKRLPGLVILKHMVVDDEVILLHQASGVGGLLGLNAVTGAITMNKTYTDWKGNTFFLSQQPLIYHNGKAIAVVSSNLQTNLVELMTGVTIPTNKFRPENRNLAFSLPDQTVLSLGLSENLDFEITGIALDTLKINLRARIHDSGGDATYGSVVIGDDCKVHVSTNHVLRTLAPLPIQNVIPILECVDRNTRVGYFTYNNTGSKGFSIPQVDDRNSLTPGAIAPVQDFIVGLGPLYPLSAQVTLDQGDTYTWVLEDYVLSFTITSDLYCPESINIIIILTGDSPFPQGFDQTVRNVFVNVTGISDSRVTLVSSSSSSNPTKRSIKQQSTLETELQVDPDPNNTESTPSEVVQQFTQSQQYAFQQQIQQQEGAPSNIDTSLAGKAQSTAIQGEIPPEPVAPPMVPTPASSPTKTPVATTSTTRALRQSFTIILLATIIAFS